MQTATQAAAQPVKTTTSTPMHYSVIRRNKKITAFDASKIQVALTKAFLEVEGGRAADSVRIHDTVENLTAQVVEALFRHAPEGGTVHIEAIQDQVELALMRTGEHKVARSYVLYREKHAKAREQKNRLQQQEKPSLHIKTASGDSQPLDEQRLLKIIQESADGLSAVSVDKVYNELMRNLYDGIPEHDVAQALIMSARLLIEQEPDYSYMTARLLLDSLRREALSFIYARDMPTTQKELKNHYKDYFPRYIKRAVELQRLDEELTRYDFEVLAAAIKPERDLQFTYLGLQTLYDRYFIHHDGIRFELPQVFFMRVAMGLAINEVEREKYAIEFYNLLSSFDFMSSTPTLFNSGTLRPQLSSCYLTTVPDDLEDIYNAIKDNALLSKFAGGLGNDWTRVRGMGAHIKGTNGKSQGVVPFLKVANDTAVAVNQCFAPETIVYTHKGPKTIETVNRGDLVLGQRGRYREVLEHFRYKQTDPMVAVDIKHAIKPITVSTAHPFFSIQGIPMAQALSRTLSQIENGKFSPQWVNAGDLKKGDYVAQVIPSEVVPVDDFNEDDARFYGILLGEGHLSANEKEFGIACNPSKDQHIAFVRDYLEQCGIHTWEHTRGETYLQICWSAGKGLARCATTGQFVSLNHATLPFSYDDLYTLKQKKKEKWIHPRFSHLPHHQALALVQGLLETNGDISRGKEIYFTNTSTSLLEGLRYQLLRLGIPTAGQYRERDNAHSGVRNDASVIHFKGITKAYDLRIPAEQQLAERLGVPTLTKKNWFRLGNCLYTRIRSVAAIDPVPIVHDLKVEGDETYMISAALVHNGGKRRGAVCAYLETWHIDIEEFLELRKNTGDERRRTHDMNTANWIPDLFMQRVMQESEWTLFSPDDTPDLHELYGEAFERRYLEYEEKAARGEIKLYKRVNAVNLWRKMLGMLFETGHPWLTFKDPCNIRSPQQHIGVVHSSNLCTEITLNTTNDEIAVCNLGSVNLPRHIDENGLNQEKLEKTVTTAMRMLDNVIDYNYYSVPQARRSNLRHRPVGLGMMGFQDALYKLNLPYSSKEAIDFADKSMEMISYYAIKGSSDLARERGVYSTFKGSLWSQGILPIDSIRLLQSQRNPEYFNLDQSSRLDWDRLREQVKTVGMRNSNTMAIAPTATISNICGISQSIEPTYQNLFVKSNLSGEFTVVNPYLVADLKALGLWDEVMVNDLKYFDGSVQAIDRIPDELKLKYTTAFELDSGWLVEAASRRQKWIDQGQSLNLYIAEASGPKLDQLYKLAWQRGLKTTYYLRSMAATHMEKSDSRNVTSVAPKVCSIDDPDCEACQ